jgi:hypothetical protein
LAFALLIDCCSFFISLVIAGMEVHCDNIASTCGRVIDVDAAFCCGASSLNAGIPKPPCAGDSVITS